jgi:Domain of unknown function (DUF4920)
MKRFGFIVFAVILVSLTLSAEELKLGKPLTVSTTSTIKQLLTDPEKYLGKDVRIEGEITGVCQNAGCWIEVRDSSSTEGIRVKVNDGEIVFPKDGAGRKVAAQGTFEKHMLTKDQYIAMLKHYAEESGKTVDTTGITEGKTVYRLKGHGAVVK